MFNYVMTSRGRRKEDFGRELLIDNVKFDLIDPSNERIITGTNLAAFVNREGWWCYLPVTVWLWGRGRVLPPVLASGGDDILDDPNGLGPIKLFDVGACVKRKFFFVNSFVSFSFFLFLFFICDNDKWNDTMLIIPTMKCDDEWMYMISLDSD